ncbi:HCLS1-associated protein X-1 [Cuculus canorus]|uniref:HCLS1-associated protein X-1 n=1 Tax=Cuculus canorus TaxID=55661 RepID=UPI0023AAC906|nr:HCLS1-associated protein X-1 [Cuculus canorus]
MSFYDAFRGFFGFPGRGGNRPRDPLFGSAAWDEDEDEDEDGVASGLSEPPQDFLFSFGFSPSFGFSRGGSRGAFEELFRDMGELLGALGGAWPALPPPLEPPQPSPQRPLRDSMLKQPDDPAPSASPGGSESCVEPAWRWSPFLGLEDAPPAPALKEDQDLDSQVSSAGLGTILRPGEPESRSYFQSISVTKVTLPDGAVEERRTVQDSQGRRETTVTRRRGDQAFITTTKEDGKGKDYREEVVNMDDRELAQFTDAWPRQDKLCTPNLSDPSSVLGSFFRRWFSSW